MIDDLFQFEFCNYTEYDQLETSLRTHQTTFFTVPMNKIIPFMEERFEMEKKKFIKTMSQRLVKTMIMILKNPPEKHDQLIDLSLEPVDKVKDYHHKKELRFIKDPPRYMTFYFEYKNYFDKIEQEEWKNSKTTFKM